MSTQQSNLALYFLLFKPNKMIEVLYSPGFGGGFYTWGAPEEAIFDKKLINLIKEKRYTDAYEYVAETYPEVNPSCVYDLKINEMEPGTKFIINEYDGSEYFIIQNETNWITAK